MQTMMESFKEWFTPPVFLDNEDKTRNAKILYALLTNVLVFLVFATLGTIFIFVQKVGSGSFILGLLILMLITRALVRRGQVLTASRLIIIGLWIGFTLLIIRTGRITTTFVSLQIAITVIAGVLLGRRPAISLTVLSILVGLGITFLESTGYPLTQHFPAPPLTSWVMWVLAFILTLTPLNPAIQNAVHSAEALRESQTKLSAIFNNSIDSILVTKTGVVVMVNPAFLQLHGYDDPNQVAGLSVLELVAPESREMIADNIRRRASGQSPSTFYQALVLKRDGTKFWVELSISTYQLDGDMYTLAVERDITRRKQMNTALEESETKFRNIFEKSIDAIGVSKMGKHVFVNPAYIKLFGYDHSDELIDKPILDLIAPDRHEQIIQYVRNRAEGKPAPTRYETRGLRKDGTTFELEVHVSTFELSGEKYTLVIERDISERKQAELILQRSRELLNETGKMAKVGGWEIDISTQTLTWTEEVYRIHEVEPDFQPTLETARDFYTSQSKPIIEQAIQAAIENGTPFNVELQIITAKGNRRYLHAFGQKRINTLYGALQDITERKRGEAVIRVRLQVNEFARYHSLNELMRNALDELCALTASPAGFFHFVEADQHTLSLQAWSTLTIEEMCTAEAQGHRYDIEQAGVWVDCIRQNAPVIHNDYASLPHRKGLPEGHAPIIREMVFPIIRDHKIVAIIGVGNKAQDYTEEDLGFASQLADILWDIIERKLAEEREREQRNLAEALSNSATALNSTLDFDDLLNRVLDNVGRVVPHDASNIMLLDEDGDTLQPKCYRGYLERGATDFASLRLSVSRMPLLTKAAHSGQPLIVSDTHAHPAWLDFPSTHWVRSYLAAPIQIRQRTVGFLNLDSTTPNFFNTDHIERLQAFVNHAAIAIENARLYEDVQRFAVTDMLTGIYNRAFFETELDRMALGRDFPVSIIIADIDDLKKVNDKFGHASGDELIKATAQILQEMFRAGDIVTRIGGDEFAMLLPNTNATTAEQMLARVREKLIKQNAAHPHLPVRLSLGTATAEQGNLVETFTIADQRMYADKAIRKSKDN